ncbi:MAG TPA: hypothetical protein VF725_04530, partial [Ktedonobacterales bacterium]
MSSDVSTQEESNKAVAPAAPTTQLAEMSIGQRLLHGDIGQLPAILMLALIIIIFQIISGGFFLKPINISNLILQEAST